MQDLPNTTENGKYTHAELNAFNKHRNEFRKSVTRYRSWTICDQLSERAERRVDSHLAVDGLSSRILYLIANNTSMRYLERTELQGGKHKLFGEADLITAIYLPLDVEWLSLFVEINKRDGSESRLVGHYCGAPAPPLEEILQQSRCIPQVTMRPLEDLLMLARQCKTGYVHRQEDMMTLCGTTYKRWVFCEPYFPRLRFCAVTCETPIATTVYIESTCLETTDRKELFADPHTLFCADGVVVIDNDSVFDTGDVFRRITPMHMPAIRTTSLHLKVTVPPAQLPPKPPARADVYTSII